MLTPSRIGSSSVPRLMQQPGAGSADDFVNSDRPFGTNVLDRLVPLAVGHAELPHPRLPVFAPGSPAAAR